MNSPSILAAKTVQEHLLTVQQTVNAIIDPATNQPVQIPDFTALMDAAGRLDTCASPGEVISVILALLGRAGCVDLNAPSQHYKLVFPADHHMHPDMGTEWYYIGCTMHVLDQHGRAGRLAVLMSMGRSRVVGLTAQLRAGWSDEQATIGSDVVAVTLDMGSGQKTFHRRSHNVQWPLKGGQLSYSKPSDPGFSFHCGPDSLTGSPDVLPLHVNIADGANMHVALKLSPPIGFGAGDAFFLQGVPPGSGVTLPKPGLYYSWPQVRVSGKVMLDGTAYHVTGGSAWIDHQIMMTSLQNPNHATHPLPFIEDPKPYDGWVWDYFNLKDGRAITGAAFMQGPAKTRLPRLYGYLLSPRHGKWHATYMLGGHVELENPIPFPALTCDPPSFPLPLVSIPATRKFEAVGLTFSGTATPWHSEGTFNLANGGLVAEFAADFKDTSSLYGGGSGFLETFSFQPTDEYRAFALAFLKSGVYPCA